MAFVKVRVPRTSQPQELVGIDPYWIGRGLTYALIATPQGMVDVGPLKLLGTYPAGAIGPFGVGSNFTGSQSQTLSYSSPTGAFTTRIAVIRLASNSGVYAMSGPAGSFNNLEFRINSGSISVVDAGTSEVIKAGSVASGESCTVGVVYGTGRQEAWKNGVLVGTNTSSVACANYAVVIGQRGGGSEYFNGLMYAQYEFTGMLTQQEMQLLTANPWQIFESEERLIWIPDAVSAGGITYTLTCSAGSYLVSGKAASFSVARRMTAGSGAYSVSGNAAALYYFAGAGPNAYALTASSGIYALSGNDLSFSHARAMPASNGAYALSGEPSGLAHARSLSAAPWDYSLSGKSAVLAYTSIGPINYTLAAMPGVYVAMGGDVNFAFSGAIKGGGMPPRKKFYVETPSGVVAVDSLIEASRIINKIKKTAVVPVVTLGGIKVEAPVKKQLDYAAIETRMRAEIQAEIDDEEDLLMLFA